MSVWSWLKLAIFLWLLRKMIKAFGWLLLAAVVVAAWPVTIVAAAGYASAWLRGWPPARLARTAAWALIPAGTWAALAGRPAARLAVRRPGTGPAWERGWSDLTAVDVARVFLLLAPVAVPAGLALGALAWAWRIYAISTGLGGIMATAPIRFDARQWRRQVRTAKGLTAAPGAVPLLARGGRIPVGGTIRAIGHRWHPVFTLPYTACARHTVIVGATGSGKTNLMMRLWAGWFTAALAAARAGKGPRPLLVVLDCKGGRDARLKADRTRRLLYGAGARRVALWPDEARLSLWDLPAAGSRRAAVPDDRHRHRRRRLLRRHHAGRGHARGAGPRRAAAEHAPGSWTGWTPGGWAPRGIRPGIPPRRNGSRARPGNCPTSSSATPPCWPGSGRRWTAPAPWPRRTPGTASWKAPGNRRSPRRRRWR